MTRLEVSAHHTSQPMLVLSLICAALILTSAFLPGSDKQQLHLQGPLHWGLHLLAFFTLTSLALGITRHPLYRTFLLFGSILLALTTEVGEHLAFHTGFEWGDVFLDICGITAGALLWGVWKQ
jgi:hypothetical protein